MSKRMFIFCLLPFFISLYISICFATMIIPSTLEYMTSESEMIITGKVADSSSYWEDSKIYTSYYIDVEEAVKTSDESFLSQIEVKVPGGKVGDIALEIDDAPTLRLGDRVMLFLNRGNGFYTTYGFNYGVYKIYYDENSRKEFIDGPLFTYDEHYDLATNEKIISAEPLGPKDFKSFLNEVEELIKKGR